LVDPDSGAEIVQERRILIDPLHPSGFAQVCANQLVGKSPEAQLVGINPVAQAGWTERDEIEGVSHLVDGRASVRATLTTVPGSESATTLAESSGFDAFGVTIDSVSANPAGEPAGAESWIARAFRGELFSRDLGILDLRARSYTPDSGRFQTADSFEGEAEEPGSLHRYLYAANDPVNRVDPSGFFTLLELDVVQKVQGNIRTVEAQTPRAALQAAKAKTWDVYWGIRFQASKSSPIHSAMFAQNLITHEGLRYEVGILGPKPLLGTAIGGIRRRVGSLEAFQKTSTWHFKVARLNTLQFIGWDRALGFLEADDSVIPVDYSVFGFALVGPGPSNCVAWSLEAALAAWAASKVAN